MSYIVRIPEPCHEDWNKMTVDEKGRFCSVCSKSVVDFSKKTDAEIHSILIENSAEKVCGRFNTNQIERPIQTNQFPTNSSGFRKIFLAAALLVFGTFLFSCKDDQGQMMGEPAFVEMKKELPKEMQPLVLGELALDSIQPQEIITIEQNMIAGGLHYDYIPELIPDSISKISNVDSVENVLNDYGVLGGAVYYEEIIDDKIENLDSINERKVNVIEQKQFNVFPNPNNGEFTVEYELRASAQIELLVYDMTGALVKQVVKSMKQQSGIYQIPVKLNELPSGIYICKLIKDNKVEIKQIVITK